MSASPMSPTRRVRCAIYTRKSSDEGLEQSFNSLDAQREACGAYILSQASEGWSALKDIYDDGGISGGTLERPALQRMLGDIAAGRIDIVVVYKVDRLTRSLLDFAKLVEAFDKAGVEFVSITQSFNTTSSMGRLTLNMLLSFAQFEREVTAERIRDKIAASKAKGMWMGGTPPIGYRPDGRSLAIVEEHAGLVRQIFELYVELGSISTLAQELEDRRLHAPPRLTATGKAIGGRPLSRGQLQEMLKNPVYIGQVAHKKRIYPGLHAPIIDPELWAKIEATRDGNGPLRRSAYQRHAYLLADKIIDAQDRLLVRLAFRDSASSGRVTYRYYCTKDRQKRKAGQGWSIPAREIESAVSGRITTAFEDALALAASASIALPVEQLAHIDERGRQFAASIKRDTFAIAPLLHQVRLSEEAVTIVCSTAAIAEALGGRLEPGAPETIDLLLDVRLRRSGRKMKLIKETGVAIVPQDNAAIIRLLLLARRWWAELRSDQINMEALAARHGFSSTYMLQIVRLAFLCPKVIEAIVKGVQPADLNAPYLVLRWPDRCWREQERALLGLNLSFS